MKLINSTPEFYSKFLTKNTNRIINRVHQETSYRAWFTTPWSAKHKIAVTIRNLIKPCACWLRGVSGTKRYQKVTMEVMFSSAYLVLQVSSRKTYMSDCTKSTSSNPDINLTKTCPAASNWAFRVEAEAPRANWTRDQLVNDPITEKYTRDYLTRVRLLQIPLVVVRTP